MPDCIVSSSGNGDARSDGSVGGIFPPRSSRMTRLKMQKRRGCKKLRMSFLQPRKHAGILAGMVV